MRPTEYPEDSELVADDLNEPRVDEVEYDDEDDIVNVPEDESAETIELDLEELAAMEGPDA